MNTQLLAQALQHNGYVRRSPARFQPTAGHKEWLHFAVHHQGLDLLANFSVVDDVRDGAEPGAEIHRIVCLVRQESWTGDIDHYSKEDVELHAGAFGMRFGRNCALINGERIQLRVEMQRRPIAMELTLTPQTLPTQANNLMVDDCPPIQWLVTPRLSANGWVRIGSTHYELCNATAYHDHNWGSFRWGKNFAWEWGYAAPDDTNNPWTMVFVRLTDRPHLTDLMQALFLWKGPRQQRVFRGRELAVWHEGFLRPRRVFKLPRVMAISCPGNVTDVPKKLVVRAERGRDKICVEFEPSDVAQVIIPNDDDLGVTIIHEVAGHVNVEGRVDGERVLIEGQSIFEFLGDAKP